MGDRICSIADCENSAVARGWCPKHWARWRRNGDPELVTMIYGDDEARFLSKVDRRGDDECWPWLGGLDKDGYGRFRTAERWQRAHRWAYEHFVKPIPDELVIDHVRANGCIRRDCVNWMNHLETVTSGENTLRGDTLSAANAAKTECPHGHPYDDENTIRRNGRRICRTCERRRHAGKAADREGP